MTHSLFVARRTELYKQLSAGYTLAAFDAIQQTNDASAPFIQEANFWYLTGVDEPGWMLVVDGDGKSSLIAPDVSEVHRIFDGGLSNEAAQKMSGVDAVVGKQEGDAMLEALVEAGKPVGVIAADPHEEYHSFVANPAPKKLHAYVKKHGKEVIDVRPLLAKMRAVKSTEEIEKIQEAVDLTVKAYEEVKDSLQYAQFEYNLDAEFTYAFRNVGATHAYEPIVAAGVNACTLHYQKNAAKLPANGLVLMDVGARIDGYCADITRTYAIGTPSEREVAVHEAVEKAHHAIIALLKPGLATKEYGEKVDVIMHSALDSLGLLSDESDYRKYFPHAVSHGLGIDVHDSLGAPEVFVEGMVLTVEPGIYIPEEGIGVRIEDDILITKDGHLNLSAALSTSL